LCIRNERVLESNLDGFPLIRTNETPNIEVLLRVALPVNMTSRSSRVPQNAATRRLRLTHKLIFPIMRAVSNRGRIGYSAKGAPAFAYEA